MATYIDLIGRANKKIAVLEQSNFELRKMIQKLEARNARLRAVLEKIAEQWFDPRTTEGVCCACEGGMHPNIPHSAEYHDQGCPYDLAKEALDAEKEA